MDMRSDSPPRCWARRVAWFGTLWIAGVSGLGLVTMLLRALMRVTGLAT
jgi:hypothetical protein